jgi:hypothetical protein
VPVRALHQHLKGVCRPAAHAARAGTYPARQGPHAAIAAGFRRPDPLAYAWVGEGQ